MYSNKWATSVRTEHKYGSRSRIWETWVDALRGVTRKTQFDKQYFVNHEKTEFQKLCSLDVLGLDVMQPDEFNHQTFKDQIKYYGKGYYGTALPWKLDHSPLPSNKQLTNAQLLATIKRFQKMQKLDQYHKVMLDQISTCILQPIPDQLSGSQMHYLPHHAVFKENAETALLIKGR